MPVTFENTRFDPDLARVLLALDYDGTEALNPRYWQQ